MLKHRVIPCVLLKDWQLVKSIAFGSFRTIGHPTSTARIYNSRNVDELIVLDIDASINNEKINTEIIADIANECFMPLTIGGGINTIDAIYTVLNSGADKVSLNSIILNNPSFIKKASDTFGSQCVVVAIDAKWEQKGKYWQVYINGGRTQTGLDTIKWAKKCQKLGAGEILLTSMDCDGTKDGFDIKLTKAVSGVVKIPVIASGGAGKSIHFSEVFAKTRATAALAASIFHYRQLRIKEIKKYLKKRKVKVRA